MRDNRNSVRKSMMLVAVVSIMHSLILGISWYNLDSFSLLAVEFQYMVPQHSPLYPLIIDIFRYLFNYGDIGAVLIGTVILQQMVFLVAVYQFIISVKYPMIMGLLFCLLYPVFFIQNGIFTEALFASFLLMLLSTAYRTYRVRSILLIDQLWFMISIVGLALTRHVGILYAILPLFVTFSISKSELGGKRWQMVVFQIAVIFLPFLVSNILKAHYYTMDMSMYGRPGMHVIEKVLRKSGDRRSVLIQKWMEKAEDDDERLAQRIISEAEQNEMWYIPRTKIATEMRQRYPAQDSILLEIRTEELINHAFQNIMLTADRAVVKQCLSTFVVLGLSSPLISFVLTQQDLESKAGSLFEQHGVFRVNYPNWLIRPLLWLRYAFCTIHGLFSFAMLISIAIGSYKRVLSRFDVFLLLLVFVQLVAHSIFTVALERYAIHMELTLFFVFVSLTESVYLDRLRKKYPKVFKKGDSLYEVKFDGGPESYYRFFRFSLAFIAILYFAWEAYWFNMVGLSFIKWHTHFVFLVLLYALIRMVLILMGGSKKLKENVLIVFIGIGLTEVVLAVTGLTHTHSERNYNVYVSPETEFSSDKSFYWIDDPQTVKTLYDKEFVFTRNINSDGYSDDEWTEAKDSGEFRILCLGDSFTEGDGADTDSSYVSFLRRKLLRRGCNVTVMNAGKCGSDPFFNFVNYRDRLARFSPDLIIQTLSRHDMTDDISLRGGMERFGENYTLSFQKAPNKTLEFFYAVSYTGRILFKLVGYNELLINKWLSRLNANEVETATVDLFGQYADFVHENDANLIVVLLPGDHEVSSEYSTDLLQTAKKLRDLPVTICDLRPFYVSKMESTEPYYWVENKHHNARGYELMSEGILQCIDGMYPRTDSTCVEL